MGNSNPFSKTSSSSQANNTSTTTNTTTSLDTGHNVWSQINNNGLAGDNLSKFLDTISAVGMSQSRAISALAAQNSAPLVDYGASPQNSNQPNNDKLKLAVLAAGAGLLVFLAVK